MKVSLRLALVLAAGLTAQRTHAQSVVAVETPVSQATAVEGYGTSVAAIGDLDGNGFGDYVVGAPLYGTSAATPEEGAVYVVRMGATSQRLVVE